MQTFWRYNMTHMHVFHEIISGDYSRKFTVFYTAFHLSACRRNEMLTLQKHISPIRHNPRFGVSERDETIGYLFYKSRWIHSAV